MEKLTAIWSSDRRLNRRNRAHRIAGFRPLLELLEPRLVFASDFGDAPMPYPTLLSEGGAEHVAIGPTLGASRDTEVNGVHSPAANGDDKFGVDDEDGVTFGTIRTGALGATARVIVTGSPAKLDAWIDFNGDGSWGGPLEQIADGVPLVPGNHTISFDVPSWAVDGPAFARFRLSTAGNLGIGGLAADGEVEDYALPIVRPVTTAGAFGGQKIISNAGEGARSVFAADVDGDGDTDVLSASRYDDTIAWHENDGSQNFTAHTITTLANAVFDVRGADVDGDGDTDVLSASFYDDKIVWYENDGNQNFVAHTINAAANGATSVFTADMDGDGDTDVLSSSYLDDKIAWYENDGSQNFTAHTITSLVREAMSVFAADVDGDGDMDVLSASVREDLIAWFENDGEQGFSANIISADADGAVAVFAADVDGDGDTDVLSASFRDHKIAWYENDGSQQFTAHTISAFAVSAVSVFAADVDGDGDTDALSAAYSDDEINWYENDGGENFTTHIISGAANGARRVIAADVDRDGDLDVLSASSNDDKIAWYENGRAKSTGFGGTDTDDPTKVPFPAPPPPGPPLSRPGVVVRRTTVRFEKAVDETGAEMTVGSAISIGLASRLSSIKRLADMDWPIILGDALPPFGE